MATRCPAGSLAKTLFPQEIVVTSVGDLKLSSQQFKCRSWKIFCLEQVNTETLLRQGTIYLSLVPLQAQTVIWH